MFSLICAWINGRANNRHAGDLRRHRAHYDVIIMDVTLKDVANFFRKKPWQGTTQKTSHSTPFRARYGLSFVESASHWYSASVSVIIYVISYYIGAPYNGSRLTVKWPVLTSLCLPHQYLIKDEISPVFKCKFRVCMIPHCICRQPSSDY